MDRDAGEWWDLLFGTWMDFLCIDFGIPGMSDEKNFSFFFLHTLGIYLIYHDIS